MESKLLYKLHKYQRKLDFSPTNIIYQQKVMHYYNLVGGNPFEFLDSKKETPVQKKAIKEIEQETKEKKKKKQDAEEKAAEETKFHPLQHIIMKLPLYKKLMLKKYKSSTNPLYHETLNKDYIICELFKFVDKITNKERKNPVCNLPQTKFVRYNDESVSDSHA
jgi:hypothetical protein